MPALANVVAGRGPAFESLQGRNPRWEFREGRSVLYGDFGIKDGMPRDGERVESKDRRRW